MSRRTAHGVLRRTPAESGHGGISDARLQVLMLVCSYGEHPLATVNHLLLQYFTDSLLTLIIELARHGSKSSERDFYELTSDGEAYRDLVDRQTHTVCEKSQDAFRNADLPNCREHCAVRF